jgi:hypothetical protein
MTLYWSALRIAIASEASGDLMPKDWSLVRRYCDRTTYAVTAAKAALFDGRTTRSQDEKNVLLSVFRLCLLFNGRTDYTKPFGFAIEYPACPTQMPTASYSATSGAYSAIRRVKLLGTNVTFPRYHFSR